MASRRQPDAEVMRLLRDGKALVAHQRTGEALALFEDAWLGLVARSEHFGASNVAHIAGTIEPDPERRHLWNERALAAADAEADRESVAGLYASLHNNLAFSLRLLGRSAEALAALRTAWSHVGAIEPGPYADQVRSVIRRRLDELEAEARA